MDQSAASTKETGSGGRCTRCVENWIGMWRQETTPSARDTDAAGPRAHLAEENEAVLTWVKFGDPEEQRLDISHNVLQFADIIQTEPKRLRAKRWGRSRTPPPL
eukprot:scaffold9553_cov33-Tisochrysis_lutea.AAC.1